MERASLVAGVIFGLLLAAPFVLPLIGEGYLLGLIIKAMLLAIAAISLDLLIGHGGMVSLGHAAFVGVGAYSAAIGLENGIENILVLLAITLGITGLVALVTGVLALRTSGVYFLMITLAFGQMIYFTLTSLASYGGDDGLTLWSLATLFGSDVVQNGGGLYFVVLGVMFATWWGVWAMSRARFGRVLRAARDNPERAEVMGFPVARYRLIAYVIAAMIAGVSGLLLVQHAEFVSPSLAAWQRSGDLIVVVVLGGLASRNGAILGAFFIVVVEEVLGSFLHEWRLIYGPLLVLMVLYARGGLSDLLEPRRGRAT
ncbi:branched-chain amino acid ABC transporter permease [Roseovarius sp. LXJ103]|uniref:branched-chain amino acid ABC transporter permease n=1 Tax=Roseovarius carneus TaxID=2853164 RepID=UPI000D60FECC|nr:branched-chain amino acid ABC transporter permease [Roseovarius carneus]MBZ8119542.1 branched-chain amino acid ABC transporter permease [Roseovarius carneus]PWE34832.1 branched-chain amino acid ABC transporter permease [Pelagicola sp. LXJ1103]